MTPCSRWSFVALGRTGYANWMHSSRARDMLGAAGMPARLPGLRLPLLVIHGGEDRLMPPSASEVVRQHAGSPDLTVRVYDGLYHEPHNEPEKDEVLADVVAWLDAHR